jgi:hypothetical protein
MSVEVFLSPMLSPSENEKSREVLQALCPDAAIIPRISKSVSVRVVSLMELYRITNNSCVILTPLCLMQLRAVSMLPVSLPPGRYVNLFLHRKKIAFHQLSQAESKRYSGAVLSMGGTVKDILEPGLDLILTSRRRELQDANTFYDRKIPLIHTDWLDALLHAKEFVDPSHYSIRRRAAPKKHPKQRLLTPCAALKALQCTNPGRVLRERERTRDIATFFLPKVKQEPPLERQPAKEIEKISEASDDHEMDIEELCRAIMRSAGRAAAPKPVEQHDLAQLTKFTQDASSQDANDDDCIIGYEATVESEVCLSSGPDQLLLLLDS